MAPKNTKKPLDASQVDPLNLSARRLYVERALCRLTSVSMERVQAFRPQSEASICKILDELGWRNVSQEFFEYEVDSNMWDSFLGVRNILKANPWPWPDKFPNKRDLSQGASPTYKKWRLQRGKPVNEAVEGSTVAYRYPAHKQDPKPAESSSTPSIVTPKATVPLVVSSTPRKPEGLESSMHAPSQKAPKSALGANTVVKAPVSKQGAEAQHSPFAAGKPAVEAAKGFLRGQIAETEALKVANKKKAEDKAAAKAEAEATELRLSDEMRAWCEKVFDAELSHIKETKRQAAEAEAKARCAYVPETEQDAQPASFDLRSWADDLDEIRDPPYLSPNAEIPFRFKFFGEDNEVPVHQPRLPDKDLLAKIWSGLGLEDLGMNESGPVAGPFELLLPSWIDFHDLVYGKDGSLFRELELKKFIEEDVVIAWRNNDKHRPVSIVVGPNPFEQHDETDRRLWMRVRSTWLRISEWLHEVYQGIPYRLDHFLYVRQDVDLRAGSVEDLTVIGNLTDAWMVHGSEGSGQEAERKRANLDYWLPEIYAALSQPKREADALLRDWVLREGGDLLEERLNIADMVFSLVSPKDAAQWYNRFTGRF
ncbi:hypothetical protein FNAPI_9696 [Fusarium napiforme]|uniref:Uncharacterized protein n=1 Tax=Fusarium napiforme TaxID=42672 RepID=A0A8H5IUN2_9HYPO|nr:hypothetical protein FNAPI_9696 [Fusarium napiforme]